jgi:hypothetical protein
MRPDLLCASSWIDMLSDGAAGAILELREPVCACEGPGFPGFSEAGVVWLAYCRKHP